MTDAALLRHKLQHLPRGPGVYVFKDRSGTALYIGKAKSLHDRVRSYFHSTGDGRPLVRFIEERAVDVEVIATRSEKEAFLLENNLIKKKKPRFNIRLKDDKTYLHLRVDPRHPFPAIVPVRRPRRDGALYFGPYSSARAIRTTLRILRGMFPLRDCSDHEFANRSRPCLKYQIKTCSAPCVGYVSEPEYAAFLEGALRVLKGDAGLLVDELQRAMLEASGRLDFERAAQLRDRISFLRNSTATQAVELAPTLDRDVVGMFRRGSRVEIAVLLFRGGKLLSASPFSFETDLPEDEALSMFLEQYYHPGRPLPAEVLLPVGSYGSDTFAECLADRAGHPVRIRVPVRGEGLASVEMASRNAELAAQANQEQAALADQILAEVQRRLGLARPPRVVECVDVSHIQGSDTVASLVRFEDAEPQRSGYRRYRVRGAARSDDYAAMQEVVQRRFGPRAGVEGFPDLLVVDGGRGQVSAARRALEQMGRGDQLLAGIAKAPRRGRALSLRRGEEERVFLAGDPRPVVLPPESEACYFLQRVRDEAHRFAVAYHRRLRSRRQRTSVLEAVEGLGRHRVQRLLQHFGGLRELKAASREQLCTVPGVGPTLAERIYRYLHASP